ncbi:MAG: DUF6266 family protein [Bacteroidota bacterium]
MARFTSSTFGKISGKHGTAVAAVRKDGLCILKEYRIASNPNTSGQKNQRGKFGFVMKELNCFRKLFTITFGGQYGINKAVSLAMKNAVTGEFAAFEMDYSHVQISEKTFTQNFRLEKLNSEPTVVSLTWSPALFPQSAQQDAISLVVLNPVLKMVYFVENVEILSKGFLQVELPNVLTKNTIHGWAFTKSETNRTIQSTYVGLLNVSSIQGFV